MRLVRIDKVENNMKLGKTVHDVRGNVLLPAGSDLGPFLAQLKSFKIQFLYIDDEISKDIEAWNILSPDTRQVLPDLMRQAERQYVPTSESAKKWLSNIAFDKIATKVAEDIFNQPELRLDVTELITNDLYLYRHELNVAIVAGLIGRMLGKSSVEIKALCMGGLLHDMGRLGLSEHVRKKLAQGGELTPTELAEYRTYPTLGYDLIKHDNSLAVPTKAAVLQHMERHDGTGFPLRKADTNIIQASKIVAIANTFDELFSGTGMEFGKTPMKVYEIVEYIQSNAGTMFDPEIATEFAKNAVIFPNGTVVKLSDGRKGIVVNQNSGFTARPIVRITHNPDASKASLNMANMMEDLSLTIEDIEI